MEYLFDRLVIKSEDLCRNDDGSMARVEYRETKDIEMDDLTFVSARKISLLESGWVLVVHWEEGMPCEAFPPHVVVKLESHHDADKSDA